MKLMKNDMSDGNIDFVLSAQKDTKCLLYSSNLTKYVIVSAISRYKRSTHILYVVEGHYNIRETKRSELFKKHTNRSQLIKNHSILKNFHFRSFFQIFYSFYFCLLCLARDSSSCLTPNLASAVQERVFPK